MGIIFPSRKPCSSPMVMVLKKEGTWHMFLDFCALNKITIKEMFLIPIIDDLLNESSGDQYLTKIYLHFGYHLTHMKEDDIPNIAFQTHEGHYELLVMPFNLCNPPPHFSKFHESCLPSFSSSFCLIFI
jgi:hypothetical protein